MKKVQIFEMDSVGRKECLNEANILQALPTHPHIIQYKHSYLYENDLYLILELASSGDISLLLEQQRQKGTYFQEAEIWFDIFAHTHTLSGACNSVSFSLFILSPSFLLRQALLRSDRFCPSRDALVSCDAS